MIGMIVDAVLETLRLSHDSIEPPSPVVISVDSQYVRGVGKQDDRLVTLLELEKVLTAKEFESLAKVEKAAKKADHEKAMNWSAAWKKRPSTSGGWSQSFRTTLCR